MSRRVRKYQRPCPALLFSTRSCVPLAAARLFHLPFAISCPAQRGKADVQSGLPADAASLRETGSVDRFNSFSHDFGVFAIEFWPAWLSPRMRLSSPDHSPLIARTRVLAIFSFCRFSSYNTASGRFYQPGETFMTHLTYSGLCCFFYFLFF